VSWADYLNDCGVETLLKNVRETERMFKQQYYGKTVSWSGYFMKVNDYSQFWFRGEHAAIFLIKMDPSESDIHADLILSMTDESLDANRFQAMQLESGDAMNFNATFVSMGNEHRLHHLHIEWLEKTEGYMEIPDHVHQVH
jgi:hypothetical protein